MLAKCVVIINGASCQVIVKPKLVSQQIACLYRVCLLALPLPNVMGCRENFLRLQAWNEKHAVCIGKNNILICHCEITEMSRSECFWITRVKPLRTCRIFAATEDRKADLDEFHCVSMAAPNNDSC